MKNFLYLLFFCTLFALKSNAEFNKLSYTEEELIELTNLIKSNLYESLNYYLKS